MFADTCLTPSFFTAAVASADEGSSSDSNAEHSLTEPVPQRDADAAAPALQLPPASSAAQDFDDFDFDSTVDMQSIAAQELSAGAPALSTPSAAAPAPGKYSSAVTLVVATSSAIGQTLDVRTIRPVCSLSLSFSLQAIEEGGSECSTPVSSSSK
jgi:hypothetical protein